PIVDYGGGGINPPQAASVRTYAGDTGGATAQNHRSTCEVFERIRAVIRHYPNVKKRRKGEKERKESMKMRNYNRKIAAAELVAGFIGSGLIAYAQPENRPDRPPPPPPPRELGAPGERPPPPAEGLGRPGM